MFMLQKKNYNIITEENEDGSTFLTIGVYSNRIPTDLLSELVQYEYVKKINID